MLPHGKKSAQRIFGVSLATANEAVVRAERAHKARV